MCPVGIIILFSTIYLTENVILYVRTASRQEHPIAIATYFEAGSHKKRDELIFLHWEYACVPNLRGADNFLTNNIERRE